MKPSDLKKDGRFSGRVNKQIQKLLKKVGMTEQKIIDAYADAVLKVDVKVKLKYGPKSPTSAAPKKKPGKG